MKDFLSNKYIQIGLRIIIGAIFIYASVGKLFNAEAFAKAIKNYDMLPFATLGIYKKGSSAIAILSLVMFLIALTSAYARGLDINCGCFSLETTATKSDILTRIFEDILMLIGILIVYIFGEKKKSEPEEIKENQIIKGEI